MSSEMLLSPHLKRAWSSSTTPSSSGRQLSDLESIDDSYLFETPPDLVCPITHAVFCDPVLTASGHVYERSAIERHLSEHATDPLTRQPLVNKSLTPVFAMKSRSREYREAAAKLCLDRACGRGCRDPVRYLRRAVELVGEWGDVAVRGLPQETLDYVASHPCNAYDRLALQAFAQGLFHCGYRDKAAAVYYHLLVTGSDRDQQASLLCSCLACWSQGPALPLLALPSGGGGGSGSSEPAGGAAPEEGGSGSVAGLAAGAGADLHVFEKLVLLFDGEASLGWGQVIDLAGEAGLGEAFVLRLCEQLLFRPMPREGPAAGELALQRQGDAFGWQQEKEILSRYVKILCQGVQELSADTHRRLQELEQRQQGGGGGAGAVGGRTGSAGRRWGRACGAVVCRPAWLGNPVVVGGGVVVALLADPQSVAGRLLRALALLALLPAPAQQ